MANWICPSCGWLYDSLKSAKSGRCERCALPRGSFRWSGEYSIDIAWLSDGFFAGLTFISGSIFFIIGLVLMLVSDLNILFVGEEDWFFYVLLHWIAFGLFGGALVRIVRRDWGINLAVFFGIALWIFIELVIKHQHLDHSAWVLGIAIASVILAYCCNFWENADSMNSLRIIDKEILDEYEKLLRESQISCSKTGCDQAPRFMDLPGTYYCSNHENYAKPLY